ncbi:MAG: magnesium chelatase [Thermoprotei archaeon]|nr:MAG: magnesium chelatase [Thermoprotei archaeon]
MSHNQERRLVYPFTAIVGQEKAKLALLCCAVDPTIGGVLLSGEKGTGKSTMVRSLAYVLPEVEVVEGCPFNCNPHSQLEMCDDCYSRYVRGEFLRAVKRRMRVVDLPLSITVDRLVGTLDIKRALKEGVRALQPGLLAEANRNILYIDEVNLLDDYVADVLLDAAAMGWNVVEREGISVKHPARFILVGSMNPEEGELRPQILDRFGLYVQVEPLREVEERVEVVRRVEEFHRDPLSFYAKYEAEEERLRSSVVKARQLIKEVSIDEDLLKLLADTVVSLSIGTHRAEIVTVKTAKAIAALDGRVKVTLEDLKKAMELSLPHRTRSKPSEPLKPPSPPQLTAEQDQGRGGHTHRHKPSSSSPPQGLSMGEEKVFNPAAVNVDLNLGRRPSSTRGPSKARGSRSYRVTVVGLPHGYPVSYMPPKASDQLVDLDLTATMVAAALRSPSTPLFIDEEDYRVRVRKHRAPKLSVIVLDSSGSMSVMRRISVAKGIAHKLIEDSYVKRDSVALITFRGSRAEVTVPPTRNYRRILEAIDSLPTGGRTPLASALSDLLLLAKRFRAKYRRCMVKAFLITDGKANVSMTGRLKEELERLALAIKESKVDLDIFDTRVDGAFDPSPSYVDLVAQLAGASVHKC